MWAQIHPLAQRWLVQGWPGARWACSCLWTCALRRFTKGRSAFAAAASPCVLSHPTAWRNLPLHPSPPLLISSPALFPLLPWIFPSYFSSSHLPLFPPNSIFQFDLSHTHTESQTRSSQSRRPASRARMRWG